MADKVFAGAIVLPDRVIDDQQMVGDGVIGVGGNAQLVELPRHPFRRPRRIGDENDGAALAAKPRQRIAGVGEGGDAVMHHAPDVAQHDVVARRERAKILGEGEGGSHCLSADGSWTNDEIARECYSDCIARGKGRLAPHCHCPA